MAILSTVLSAPALAASEHEACDLVGDIARQDLQMAKKGYNSYESLANDPKRMMKYGMNTSVLFLTVFQTIWENRHTYSPVDAYKAGYKICLEMRKDFES